jgi:hypothetical protein
MKANVNNLFLTTALVAILSGFLIPGGSILAQIVPLQQVAAQPMGERVLPGHVLEFSKKLAAIGRLPGTNELHLAIWYHIRHVEPPPGTL